MKTIIVQWVDMSNKPMDESFGYKEEMRVVISDHPRFSPETRFDYGFFNIATREGYTIISLPIN